MGKLSYSFRCFWVTFLVWGLVEVTYLQIDKFQDVVCYLCVCVFVNL